VRKLYRIILLLLLDLLDGHLAASDPLLPPQAVAPHGQHARGVRHVQSCPTGRRSLTRHGHNRSRDRLGSERP
jgi:hypothetical protein